MLVLMILKVALLFLSVVYGVTIIGRLVSKDSIYGTQISLFAIGLVGFVTLQFNLLIS